MVKVMESKFTKVNGSTFLFCHPYYIALTDIKLPALVGWRVGEVKKGSPIVVQGCVDSDHGNHMYLAPFHLTNPELLTIYEEIMNSDNDTDKGGVERDYQTLRQIKDNPSTPHEHTKFHCTGQCFNNIAYRESDWTTRFFYSITRHLPANTSVRLIRTTLLQCKRYSPAKPHHYFICLERSPTW